MRVTFKKMEGNSHIMKRILFVLIILSVFLLGCTSNQQPDNTVDQNIENPPDTRSTDTETDDTYTDEPLDENTTNSDMLNGEGEFEVNIEMVNYFESVNGYLAIPAQAGNYPGVILIHEWWGLNQNIKDMAAELASNGYAVLAVDLYNGKVATDSNQARELVSSIDKETAVENMKAAITYLKETQSSTRVASLGWCFGGGQSLQLALSGEQPVDATLIYYGSLVTDKNQLSKINWPVMGVFGDKDTSIPVESVNEFDAALDELGIENEIYLYQGVGHAFANPSGQNYAPIETADAWQKTLTFLEKSLKNS